METFTEQTVGWLNGLQAAYLKLYPLKQDELLKHPLCANADKGFGIRKVWYSTQHGKSIFA